MIYNTLYPIVLNQYKNKIFVETGLWHGYGIRVALDCGFEKIFSCDVNDSYINECKSKYTQSNVKIVKEKSTNFLINFFETEQIYENITFWLDAHDDVGTPIIDELQIIKNYCVGKNNIFLIDDYHILSVERWGKSTKKEEIENLIKSINPNFKLKVQPRIYSLSTDINEKNLPTKGTILAAKL